MRAVVWSLTLGVTLSAFAFILHQSESPAQAKAEQASGCALATQALESASKLKPGAIRADVEKDFDPDGGLSMRSRATYVYRRCRYVKIDVEFRIREGSQTTEGFSPDDQVSRVSSPYLAYPVSD
jgi:hypothetical protein